MSTVPHHQRQMRIVRQVVVGDQCARAVHERKTPTTLPNRIGFALYQLHMQRTWQMSGNGGPFHPLQTLKAGARLSQIDIEDVLAASHAERTQHVRSIRPQTAFDCYLLNPKAEPGHSRFALRDNRRTQGSKVAARIQTKPDSSDKQHTRRHTEQPPCI